MSLIDVYNAPLDPGCPACGDTPDYCQGHGEMGDPDGYRIIELHDDGVHSDCHGLSDCKL